MAEEEKAGETLSLLQYLPLLDGWEFKIWATPEPVTVTKNSIDLIKRFEEDGWLVAISVACDDAYVTPYVHYPTIPIIPLQPYAYHVLGETIWGANTPYVTRYYQPNPLSTAGLYMVEYQPAYPMPYKGWTEILAELDTPSTQSSATIINAGIGRIVITDPSAFRRSLKEVLGTSPPAKIIPPG